LSDSLLNKKLKNAKSYDRIAGYFSSSILEVAGEEIESMEGKVRIICNSDLDSRDIVTAKSATNSLRKEWCDFKPEDLKNSSIRFKKLYDLLSSKKMEVRVLPSDKFGLIHGKAGVITLSNGKKTSFLGSTNESLSAWNLNYELVWEDDSKEAVDWVQEEFDALWNDSSAMPLSDFIIDDIKRISERKIIDRVEDWKKSDTGASPIVIESPVYRQQFGLWEHQKYFIDKAFNDHKMSYGAKYLASKIYTKNTDKILFTTYSKKLTKSVEYNLKNMCNLETLKRIEVVNLHSWIAKYLKEHNISFEIIDDQLRYKYINSAIKKLNLDETLIIKNMHMALVALFLFKLAFCISSIAFMPKAVAEFPIPMRLAANVNKMAFTALRLF
jgi:hypothetical protein